MHARADPRALACPYGSALRPGRSDRARIPRIPRGGRRDRRPAGPGVRSSSPRQAQENGDESGGRISAENHEQIVRELLEDAYLVVENGTGAIWAVRGGDWGSRDRTVGLGPDARRESLFGAVVEQRTIKVMSPRGRWRAGADE